MQTLIFQNWTSPSRSLIGITILLIYLSSSIALGQEKMLLPVTLNVKQQVTVASREDGFIKKISVEPGQAVAANEMIAQLDPREVDLELEKAQLDLQSLQIAATDDSEIRQALAKRKSASEYVSRLGQYASAAKIPQLELVRAQSDLDESNAALDGAKRRMKKSDLERQALESEIKTLRLRRQKMDFSVPFDGQVAETFKHVGEFAKQGESIALVYRLDVLTGVALVSNAALSASRAKEKRVRLDINGIQILTQVARVSPRVDAANMYRIYVDVPNRKTPAGEAWELLPGMTIKATLVLDADAN